jgi:hypothetical protein
MTEVTLNSATGPMLLDRERIPTTIRTSELYLRLVPCVFSISHTFDPSLYETAPTDHLSMAHKNATGSAELNATNTPIAGYIELHIRCLV